MSDMCMKIRLTRVQQGYAVNVWASPLVEEFVRGLGNGTNFNLTTSNHHNNRWQSSTGGDLRCWHSEIGDRAFSNASFSIDHVGAALDLSSTHGEGYVNMAFLRLVGISNEGGVTFIVPGVHTLDALRTLKNNIATAAQRLYSEYIRPVDLTIELTTQEQRG